MVVPERYVTYLLSDIDAAFRKEPQILIIDHDEDADDYLNELQDWLDQDEESLQSFSWHCGLSREMFPPPASLTDPQKERIIEAFHYLLLNYNLSVILPEYLELDMEYELLVSILDQKVTIIDHGYIGIEFCDYNTEECVFGDQCMCNGQFDGASYNDMEVTEEMEWEDIFQSLLMDSFDQLYYDDEQCKWDEEDSEAEDLPF
ncbi:MAG TPA: hypothetical protein PKC30_13825 [Saprospiraceae bacterium]|nr:hypothetical protein [Saprospiraceae bacterium]